MKNNEDIGTLLEKKLHGAKRTPSESLWDRVDATLNKKNKRRKRFLWFWTGGATFLLIVALLYAVSPSSEINNNSKKQTIKLTTDIDIIEETSEEQQNVNKKSDVKLNSVPRSNPIENTETKAISREPLSEKTKVIINISKSLEKNKRDDTITEDGYEVKTNFYYYNGENDEHIKTSDKKIIDSLLNSSDKQIDTLITRKTNIIKNDSL